MREFLLYTTGYNTDWASAYNIQQVYMWILRIAAHRSAETEKIEWVL